jgi:peptidoglycan/LPS O-acetylase OafA/YrhL
MATVLVAWGFTFYFVEYTVYSNTSELKDMQQTLTFNIVSGVVYTAPVFFFVSGFLQAFAFMQKDKNGSMFTLEAIFSYYFRKLMRYVPLNIVAMLALLYVLPLLGDGPVWNKFAVATQGCNTYWWTNIVWISNVYPRAYDDKCMPWTWFVPCYV